MPLLIKIQNKINLKTEAKAHAKIIVIFKLYKNSTIVFQFQLIILVV